MKTDGLNSINEKEMIEYGIKINSNLIPLVCGINDVNLKKIRNEFEVDLYVNDGEILIHGNLDKINVIKTLMNNFIEVAKKNSFVSDKEVNLLIEQAKTDSILNAGDKIKNSLKLERIGKKIEPKTQNQIEYFNLMNSKDLVVSYGPAGTGKTYLAVGYAISQLLSNNYKRIILTRPVVEAGESLGFLPGDFIQKISPYLKPLYDSIFDIAGLKMYEYMQSKGLIEIVPLAYMRGRTLNDAIIILDEAQNATLAQIKMFLTRFGFNSKVIITGDTSQVDLPKKQTSGLKVIVNLFKKIPQIGLLKFEKKDVVRHPLIKKIIQAFDDYENNSNNS